MSADDETAARLSSAQGVTDGVGRRAGECSPANDGPDHFAVARFAEGHVGCCFRDLDRAAAFAEDLNHWLDSRSTTGHAHSAPTSHERPGA